MKRYKVAYEVKGKGGLKYEYVMADADYEAKEKVQRMYGDSVHVFWAQKEQ